MKSTAVIALVAAGGLVVGGGAIAAAQIPSSTGQITACYLKSGGSLRVIDSATAKCKSTETQLTWNQSGVPGQDGTSGTDGTNGVSGYEVVRGTFTIEAGTQYLLAGATAKCPAGKVITGGGSSLEGSDGRQFFSTVYEIFNSGPGSDPNSWAVSFGTARATDSSNAGDKVVATAYCIDAPAATP
jgi:hypothetical protein